LKKNRQNGEINKLFFNKISMKKLWIIIGIVAALAIVTAGFFILPKVIDKTTQTMRGGEQRCSAEPGEWVPGRGECPGTTIEIQTKCNEFCEKHPDCCGERGQGGGGGEEILPAPSEAVVSNLKRNYPETIKALNEGPNIYSRGVKSEIISDEKLAKAKAIGFNTVQVLLIGKKANGKLIFNEINNSVLLNDIVAIKKHGMAVWVALDIAGAPANMEAFSLGNYDDFKSSFLDFTKNSAELMERYKVEYFTANNEPDKPFREQKQWSVEEINNNLVDFLPAVNAVAREKFNGKLINKITQTRKHVKKVIDASFKNVDIAGVDVGPPMDGGISLKYYGTDLDEYQYYASLAEKAGVSWMNAEYWMGDFDYEYSDFVKNNELEYAKVSFESYLKTTPKGVGYVWNDIRTFSLSQGEETGEALKSFFDKI